MPRRPKPKNTLSAGQRAAMYEAEMEEKQRRLRDDSSNADIVPGKQIVDSVTEKVDDTVGEQGNVKAAKIKMLPKPQAVTVNVDFGVPVGVVKPMHGMCNGPKSYGADISELFRDIGVPSVRFDCTDTAISACAVDISRIFKDADADPYDPENYDFAVTDEYVEAALLTGAKVLLRLGESRDPFSGKTFARRIDKEILSRVCVNIIRHYNDRWANGFSYGIDCFEVWNFMTDLSVDENLEIYKTISTAIKLYDESIKVGGMSCQGLGDKTKNMLRFCKKNRVPLEFLSVDVFYNNPFEAAVEARDLALFAKKIGLPDVGIVVGKWCYAPVLSSKKGDNDLLIRTAEEKRNFFEAQRSLHGAAFAAAFMLEGSHVEEVCAGYHFDAQPMISPFCSICDRFGSPEKSFYAFKAYGELYRAGTSVLCEVEEKEGFARSGISALASVSELGHGYVMIASFDGCGTVDIRLDGIGDEMLTADVYMLDGVKNMELADSVPLSGMKKRLVMNVSAYGAILIKLY